MRFPIALFVSDQLKKRSYLVWEQQVPLYILVKWMLILDLKLQVFMTLYPSELGLFTAKYVIATQQSSRYLTLDGVKIKSCASLVRSLSHIIYLLY
ncbi:hypothetical protein DsansV1_C01g0012721 [Dioscorea sansibarensis]